MLKKNKNLSLEEKFFAAVSYVWLAALIPLLLYRNHDYVEFHARQGFLLFALESASTIILAIPVFGWIIGGVGWVVAIIFSVRGIISALSGKQWIMPWLGGHASRFKIH